MELPLFLCRAFPLCSPILTVTLHFNSQFLSSSLTKESFLSNICKFHSLASLQTEFIITLLSRVALQPDDRMIYHAGQILL